MGPADLDGQNSTSNSRWVLPPHLIEPRRYNHLPQASHASHDRPLRSALPVSPPRPSLSNAPPPPLFQKTTLYVIPKDHISRDTYVGLQQHLRATQPGRQYLTAYSSFDMLNKTDASLSVRQQWAKMVQHVNGVSAEMTVPFIARWPTPIQFYEETMIHRLELEDQNGMEVDEPSAKGRGKAKKRLAENFVTETLAEGRGDGDMGARCIKGVNGVKLWDLATATGKYPTKDFPVKGGKD